MIDMPRNPFEKKMKFGGKQFSFHSNPRNKRLADQKAKTLRNGGLNARVYSKKSTSGGRVYAIYEAIRKKKR